MKSNSLKFIVPFFTILILIIGVYNIPAVKTRITYEVDSWRASVKYAVSPPEKEVFVENVGGTTEERELIEVLEMSLKAELEPRSTLSDDLAETRTALRDKAVELDRREASLEKTRNV